MPLSKQKEQEQLKRNERKWTKPLMAAGFTVIVGFQKQGTLRATVFQKHAPL